MERFIDYQRESKTYELTTVPGGASIADLHQIFDTAGLTVIECSHDKKDDILVSEFQAIGKHDKHTSLVHSLIETPTIREVST